MVSFVDLLPAARRTKTISVLGVDVEVRSLKLREVAEIMWDFPEIRALMSERQVDAEVLLRIAPRAAATIIAAATGNAGKEAEIDAIGELAPGTQLALLFAALELSMPEGISPLLEAVARVFGIANVAAAVNGRDQDGNMPPRSNGSLPAATA
jgi:hypothetical protein